LFLTNLPTFMSATLQSAATGNMTEAEIISINGRMASDKPRNSR
jgi:hypothetical protein